MRYKMSSPCLFLTERLTLQFLEWVLDPFETLCQNKYVGLVFLLSFQPNEMNQFLKKTKLQKCEV